MSRWRKGHTSANKVCWSSHNEKGKIAVGGAPRGGQVDGTSLGADLLPKDLEACVAWGADDRAEDSRMGEGKGRRLLIGGGGAHGQWMQRSLW